MSAEKVRVTSPGRVNLLGEHVDYNDGIVMPAAINRAIKLTASTRGDRLLRVQAVDLDASAVISLDRLAEKVDAEGKPLPGWALYPAGVAHILQQHNLTVSGVDAAFTSDIPIGAGLSSSAAVEVAFAVLWQTLGGWEIDRITLARLCQQAENRYVGVNCGLMDQFACANGVEDHLLAFDIRSLQFQSLPLSEGLAIVIADSGVRHSLITSAYNDRRQACEQAVELLKPHLPGIRALRDVTPAQFNQYAGRLPETIARRARHVVEEIDRVEQAMGCLRRGDAAGFGQLMYAGHASMRDLYEASCPEIDILVEIASHLPGCLGARITGGGFGGCSVNLVIRDQAEKFISLLKQGYDEQTGKRTEVYCCRASRGAYVEII